MKMLRLSPGLSLPLEAVTRRLAILAMSGAGKSNTAVVLAEQMFDAGIPWVAIDPKGDWWGIRSSRDGSGPGLQVPIFGGLHGDIPLEPGAGRIIGDLIVDQRLTCVLDISEFAERQQMWGFLIDLGETLLRRNRQALHLFLEECDEYLPQRTSEKGNLPKCLGVWQRVVKRGRFRGIGSTQITQRNASLNKDTLYQAEALIAMRVTGKADRDAVAGWVEYHNASSEIVASLPTLADGEGWISSPAWLRQTKRITFDRRRTFDSGATPVLLKGNAPPATLADVDLAELSKRMASTIEKAKADDPRELRRQIADLKKQLAARPAAAPAKPIEVQVLDPRLVVRIEEAVKEHAATQLKALEASDTVRAAIGELQRTLKAALNLRVPEKLAAVTSFPGPRPMPSALTARAPREPGRNGLGSGERRILVAVAQHEGGVTREQLSVLAGYKKSTRDLYVQLLRSRGLIEASGDRLVRTDAAFEVLGTDFQPLPTGDELLRYWTARLPGGERRTLEAIVQDYPNPIDRDDVSQRTGYKKSTRDLYIQLLRSRQLITVDDRGGIRASETLFS